MSLNKTLLEILASREDVSDYLFHFTKGANANIILGKILADGKLKDIGNKGVICFTEAPLNSMLDMFKIFGRYSNPYYAPYGIAIKKSELYALGARPVIYGDSSEINLIHDSIKWRFESYNPSKKDFTWLREWRINLKEVALNNKTVFAVVNTQDDLLNLTCETSEIKIDGCVSDGQFDGYAYVDAKLNWRGVSMQGITMHDLGEKAKLEDEIGRQNIGDEFSVNLGWINPDNLKLSPPPHLP